VVVRLHPSAYVRGTFWWQNTSLAPRRSGFDSRRLHFRRSRKCPRRRKAARTTPPLSLRRKKRLRSVNGSTRPLYGRSAGSTPAGGSLASLSGGGSRRRLAPLSVLLPTGRATRHCPACIQALSDASGNRELDARSSVESTALIRQARWFDSSRAHSLPWPASGYRRRSPPRRLASLTALLRAARAPQHCSARIQTLSDAPRNREACGRSSDGRAPGRHPEEARSIRVVRSRGPWCNRKHRELQPRGSGFESWRTCRRGPERLGYLVRAVATSGRCGSTPLPDRTP
jgi:hypothetical protein